MTASRYIVEDTPHSGRRLDLEAFGRDLAADMGAEVEVKEPGSHYPVVSILCGDGLEVSLRACYGARLGKVELHGFTDAARGLPAVFKFPAATVDTGRDMAAIAKDVQRRIVEPSRAIVEQVNAARAARDAKHDKMKALATLLVVAYPGLSVEPHGRDATEAAVYFNRGGIYLTGSIDAAGRLNVQRLSITTAEQARALFALMSEGSVS